jgi:hypothetical protein
MELIFLMHGLIRMSTAAAMVLTTTSKAAVVGLRAS